MKIGDVPDLMKLTWRGQRSGHGIDVLEDLCVEHGRSQKKAGLQVFKVRAHGVALLYSSLFPGRDAISAPAD